MASPETAKDAKAIALSAQKPTMPSVAEQPQQAVLPNKEAADSAPPAAERRDTAASTPGGAMLRPKQAVALTGLARSMFYERQNSKSKYFDPTFPQARSLGESSRGYPEAEVDQWISGSLLGPQQDVDRETRHHLVPVIFAGRPIAVGDPSQLNISDTSYCIQCLHKEGFVGSTTRRARMLSSIAPPHLYRFLR